MDFTHLRFVGRKRERKIVKFKAESRARDSEDCVISVTASAGEVRKP